MTASARPPFPPRQLEDADFDVVIVGGGIAGAGVARDLALRGVRVALVEKNDFAYGTTSRSSKLIHGGLRYLELYDFGLVRESLRERETLRRLAPHVIKPLPFLIPVYRDSSRGLVKVRIGLKVYDWLTPGRNRERYRVLRPIDALSLLFDRTTALRQSGKPVPIAVRSAAPLADAGADRGRSLVGVAGRRRDPPPRRRTRGRRDGTHPSGGHKRTGEDDGGHFAGLEILEL